MVSDERRRIRRARIKGDLDRICTVYQVMIRCDIAVFLEYAETAHRILTDAAGGQTGTAAVGEFDPGIDDIVCHDPLVY